MMKKHLALLCGVLYPQPSATGLCAERFADLLSDEYDIDIICISSSGRPESAEKNAMRIHALLGKRMQAERAGTGLKKQVLHALGGAQIKTSMLGNLSWFRSAALRCLEQEHKRRPFDAVFSVCSPFAAHCAAMDFCSKHADIRWCAYTVDPYASDNRIRPFGCSLKRLTEFECEVCSRPDALLLSEEAFASCEALRASNKNCRALPYLLPAFNEAEPDRSFFSEQGIHCVYAGSFYPELRNPQPMLDAFCALSAQSVYLHLFSKGCEQMISEYAARDQRIVRHDPISHDRIVSVYQAADVLVNVENNVPEFLPSKTFEYIAACKPIVCFGKGQSRELLASHPAAVLCEGGANDAECLQTFLQSCFGTSISAEDISRRYEKYHSQHIRQILSDALIGC